MVGGHDLSSEMVEGRTWKPKKGEGFYQLLGSQDKMVCQPFGNDKKVCILKKDENKVVLIATVFGQYFLLIDRSEKIVVLQ